MKIEQENSLESLKIRIREFKVSSYLNSNYREAILTTELEIETIKGLKREAVQVNQKFFDMENNLISSGSGIVDLQTSPFSRSPYIEIKSTVTIENPKVWTVEEPLKYTTVITTIDLDTNEPIEILKKEIEIK